MAFLVLLEVRVLEVLLQVDCEMDLTYVFVVGQVGFLDQVPSLPVVMMDPLVLLVLYLSVVFFPVFFRIVLLRSYLCSPCTEYISSGT